MCSFWQSDLVHLYKEVTNTWGKNILAEEKASEMLVGWADGSPCGWRAAMVGREVGHDVGDVGRGQVTWGLCRPAKDFRLQTMWDENPLCCVESRRIEHTLCAKGSLWLYEWWTGGQGVEWGKSGSYYKCTKQRMIVAYKDDGGLDVKK